MTVRSIKSFLKEFLTFWKPSLATRFTLSFTIFGLLIGYAVFIFLAVSSTNAFVKLASGSVREYLDSVSREHVTKNQDELYKVINQQMTNLAKAAQALQGITPELKFDLYFQNGALWQRAYMDKQGVIKSEKITNPAVSKLLEKAKTEKFLTYPHLFYGAQDKVNVKINISTEKDGYTNIISFDFPRMGLLKILRENIYKAIIFLISNTFMYA